MIVWGFSCYSLDLASLKIRIQAIKREFKNEPSFLNHNKNINAFICMKENYLDQCTMRFASCLLYLRIRNK